MREREGEREREREMERKSEIHRYIDRSRQREGKTSIVNLVTRRTVKQYGPEYGLTVVKVDRPEPKRNQNKGKAN